MTIRMRMILSHILVCVLPIIMTLFVLASSLAGLILYAKAGNHVMPESDYQFDTITRALSMDIFHTMRHGEIRRISSGSWILWTRCRRT